MQITGYVLIVAANQRIACLHVQHMATDNFQSHSFTSA